MIKVIYYLYRWKSLKKKTLAGPVFCVFEAAKIHIRRVRHEYQNRQTSYAAHEPCKFKCFVNL